MRRPFLKQLTAAAVAALIAVCPFGTGSTASAVNIREEIPSIVSAPSDATVTIGTSYFYTPKDTSVTIPIVFESDKPIKGVEIQLFADGLPLSESLLNISSITTSPKNLFDAEQPNTKNGSFTAMCIDKNPPKFFTMNYKIKPSTHVKPGSYHITANIVIYADAGEPVSIYTDPGTLYVVGDRANGTAKVTIDDLVVDPAKDKEVQVTAHVTSNVPMSGTEMRLMSNHAYLPNDDFSVKSIEFKPQPFDDCAIGLDVAGFNALDSNANGVDGNFDVIFTLEVNKNAKAGTYKMSTRSLFLNEDNKPMYLDEIDYSLKPHDDPESDGTVDVTVSDATFDPNRQDTASLDVTLSSDIKMCAASMQLLCDGKPFPNDLFQIKSITAGKGSGTVSKDEQKAMLVADITKSGGTKGPVKFTFELAPGKSLAAGTYDMSVDISCSDDNAYEMKVNQTIGKLTVKPLEETTEPPETTHFDPTETTAEEPTGSTDPIEPTAAEPTGSTDPTETTAEEPSDSTDTTTPTKPPIKPSKKTFGDMDGDQKLGIVDVIILNKNLMVGEPLSDEAKENADVDQNGKIDETDALNILKAVVEIITLPMVD